MPKAVPIPLSGDDLIVQKPRQAQAGAMRQRGVVPSAELIPLQFRMPPEFIQQFKQAALDRRMKLNELLNVCFQQFMKNDT